KMSPLSDTTNLAPAMVGGDLFTHIKYMTFTTVPTWTISLLVFIILGLTINTNGMADTKGIKDVIDNTFHISGWLFLVPLAVIFHILKKAPPLLALLIGTLLGGIFALIFQPEIVMGITGAKELTFESAYKGVMNAITIQINIATESQALSDLFSSKGMAGMLGTIWLIICAMVFGGVMDGIGALSRISSALLSMARSTFGLFAKI